jgi:hypothetical protein
MANGFYQHGMKNAARGNMAWLASGGDAFRAALVDTADYSVDLAAHDFLDDIAAGAREETSGNMTLIDAAVDGVLDANDVALVGTTGDQCEGILLYRFVTNDADSLPYIWWDSVTGMPVTLGGDVTIAWDNGANKIAKI